MIDFNDLQDTFVRALWIIFGVTYVCTMLFWLIGMQRALEKISPQFRKMAPTNVWLTFIPLYGFFWQFYVVIAVADGLFEEFRQRNTFTRESRPGYNSGLTAGILCCCALIPLFGVVIALVGTIPRLMHLSKINSHLKELEQIDLMHQQASQVTLDAWRDFASPKPDPFVQQDPSRFMPPPQSTPEEDWERWRKK